MEQVRDLNMEADDMQVVLSALKGVRKWQRHTNRSLAVSTFSRVKRCAKGCTSALAPCRTIGIGELSPTPSSQEKSSIRPQIWKRC